MDEEYSSSYKSRHRTNQHPHWETYLDPSQRDNIGVGANKRRPNESCTPHPCFPLSRSPTITRAVSEYRPLPIHCLQVQETQCLHLRHRTTHQGHHLAKLLNERSSSHYAKVLLWYQHAFLNNPVVFGPQSIPPWILLTPDVRCKIPSILPFKCELNEIFDTRGYRSHMSTRRARRVLQSREQRSSSRPTTFHSAFSL